MKNREHSQIYIKCIKRMNIIYIRIEVSISHHYILQLKFSSNTYGIEETSPELDTSYIFNPDDIRIYHIYLLTYPFICFQINNLRGFFLFKGISFAGYNTTPAGIQYQFVQNIHPRNRLPQTKVKGSEKRPKTILKLM